MKHSIKHDMFRTFWVHTTSLLCHPVSTAHSHFLLCSFRSLIFLYWRRSPNFSPFPIQFPTFSLVITIVEVKAKDGIFSQLDWHFISFSIFLDDQQSSYQLLSLHHVMLLLSLLLQTFSPYQLFSLQLSVVSHQP